jgi:hypothetical protein
MSEEQTPPPQQGVAVVGEDASTSEPRGGRRRLRGLGERLVAAGHRLRGTEGAHTVAPATSQAPSATSDSPARPPRLPAGTRVTTAPAWLVPVLLVVTAVSLVLAVGFAIAWADRGTSQRNTQDTVKRVASDFLLALTNFSPTSIDSDFRTISTYATGDFVKQSNQFFGSSIRQKLEQVQAQSQGQLRYVYIQSLSGHTASVYAEVDQTYASRAITTPRSDVLQVVLSMLDTSSGWKISAVTVLQPPSSTGTPTGNAAGTGSGSGSGSGSGP